LSEATIMVVEDDDATREFLADNLRADSYAVVAASSGRQALNLLEVKDCDLMLLDVMLPDASGFELCRQVREADGLAQRIDPQIPVIMLTGRSSENDRVRGFARGADDYVVKPFHYQELAARIEAVLRRSRGRRGEGVLQVGELRVDPVSRDVTVAGKKVELSAKEFALLRTLAAEPMRVFTKEELLRDVWGFKLMGTSRRPRTGLATSSITPRTPAWAARTGRMRMLGSSPWLVRVRASFTANWVFLVKK
jgi:DNA-binding response OmpR family regulator